MIEQLIFITYIYANNSSNTFFLICSLIAFLFILHQHLSFILLVWHKFDSSHRFYQICFVDWSHIWWWIYIGKIIHLWDVLFVFLLSRIRLVYPDCSFLLLHFKRFLLFPASTSSILKHLFLWPIFCGTVLNTIVLSSHPSALQWTTRRCRLCIVLVAQNIQEAFNSTCSECPAYILLQGAAWQNLRRNKEHHHKRQPCKHHQQSRVTRGDSKLPAFEVFFILWKPLKSTSLWWLGPECKMQTTMSMGMNLMKNYKWFKRSSNFDGNRLKTTRIYHNTIT